MVAFVCLHITLPHYHNNADLSESIELLTCLSDTFCLKRVSKIWSNQLSFMQYMGIFVFSLPIYFMMIVRICVLYLAIIVKLEVWSICHRLGLGHAIMVYAVYLFICSRLGPCVSFDAPPHLSYPSLENTTRRCWEISDSPFISWVGRVSLNWFQVLSLLPYQISAHIKCFTSNVFVI